MKKRIWLYLCVIILNIAALAGYSALDRMWTDTKAPEIMIDEELLLISAAAPKDGLLQGVTAVDRADGDVTDSLVVEQIRLLDQSGRVSVQYAAFDAAGNVAKAAREVQYTDYESPRFVLTDALLYAQNASLDILRAVQAQDMLDGDISRHVRATPLEQVSSAAAGTYDVEFRVTNSLGDTARLVLPLEIYPVGSYQAELRLTDYLIYVEQGSSFDKMDYLKELAVGGAVVRLDNGIPATCSLKTEGTVNTNVPGVYSISYKVTCSGAAGYSKLIVVVEG